jgi:hypothetical protein
VTLTGNVQRLLLGGQQSAFDSVCAFTAAMTAVHDGSTPSIQFSPAAPNPFNPSTTLRFSLAQAGHVRVSIFDAAGRLVTTLVDEVREAGAQAVTWNGRNEANRVVPAGFYFVRAESHGTVQVQKIALIK